MTKLSILTLSCVLAFAFATSGAQDPNNKAKTKGAAKAVTKQRATNTRVGVNNHVRTNNVNKTSFRNTNKTVNNNNNTNNTSIRNTNKAVNNNKTITNNKTVNKFQANKVNKVNNTANANTKVKTLHQANAAKWNQIHQQHQNFHAINNGKIASAKFNAKFHIAGAQNWKGNHYAAFKNYHPMWHDHFWWHNHYHNVLLFGGGWYYWNSGDRYPAWGYDDSAAYYPYDGPIYVGSNPAPADQVIADVQTSLQEQGFYQGEVDGLLGPQTRAALADYQQAQGLEMTAAIDEPTLESLGMS